MPLKLIAPLVERFELTASDEEFGNTGDPTFVVIRQATQLENEYRSRILSKQLQIVDGKDLGKMKFATDWNIEELKRIETMITMCGCNILDSDGKELFKFMKNQTTGLDEINMSEFDFKQAYGRLPSSIANEIYKHVLEVNFGWKNPFLG